MEKIHYMHRVPDTEVPSGYYKKYYRARRWSNIYIWGGLSGVALLIILTYFKVINDKENWPLVTLIVLIFIVARGCRLKIKYDN